MINIDQMITNSFFKMLVTHMLFFIKQCLQTYEDN